MTVQSRGDRPETTRAQSEVVGTMYGHRTGSVRFLRSPYGLSKNFDES